MKKYLQIYQQIKDDIIRGKYPERHRFPIELEFAAEMNVARMTLRSAMKLLEREGFVNRLPRLGTFVASFTQREEQKILVVHDVSMDTISSPGQYIMPGIENNCRFHGLKTTTVTPRQIAENQCDLSHGNYIGIILLTPDEQVIDFCRESNLPAVIPNAFDNQAWNEVSATIGRDIDTGFMIPRHLIGYGHRKILTLSTSPDSMRGIHFEIYRDFLRRNGCDNSMDLIRCVDFQKLETIKNTLELMKENGAPTAIYCYSDFMAIYVMGLLRQMNLSVPDDVSVAGYCGYPGSALLTPALTTLDLQYHERGKLAVKIILAADEWLPSGKMPHIELVGKLEARKSTEKIIFN